MSLHASVKGVVERGWNLIMQEKEAISEQNFLL